MLFTIGVDDETLELTLFWDGGIGTPVGVVATEGANRACRFLDRFRREHRLQVHALLSEALALYRSSGPNEHVGIIPTASVLGVPRFESPVLHFELQVGGQKLTGTFRPDLTFWCEGDSLISATAGHCVLAYAASHRAELAALGFDTTELERQLRLPSMP